MIEHTESFKNLSNVSDFYYQQRYNSFDAEDALTVEQELARTNLLSAEAEVIAGPAEFNAQETNTVDPAFQWRTKKIATYQSTCFSNHRCLFLIKYLQGLMLKAGKNYIHIINQYASSGTTIILITDERELPSCITHIAELHNGKLVQYAARKNFVATPS